MIGIKYCILFMLLSCYCQKNLFSQRPIKNIDSLLVVLKSAKEDTTRLRLLNIISKQYETGKKYDDEIKFAHETMALADKILASKEKSPKIILAAKVAIGYAWLNISMANSGKRNYTEALKSINKVIEIRSEIKDRRGIGKAYIQQGDIYNETFKSSEALKSYERALEAFQEVHDSLNTGITWAIIGSHWSKMGKNDEALDYYYKILIRLGNIKSPADYIYINIGNIYARQGKYEEALKNYKEALEIRLNESDLHRASEVYNTIGYVYQLQGNYAEALRNFFEALKIKRNTDDKSSLSNTYNYIGRLYLRLGDTEEALKYLQIALNIKEEIGERQPINDLRATIANIKSGHNNLPELNKYKDFGLTMLKIYRQPGPHYQDYMNKGNVLESEEKYSDAYFMYTLALQAYKKIKFNEGIAAAHQNIGRMKLKLAASKDLQKARIEIDEARMHLDSALMIARETGHRELVLGAYQSLAEIYQLSNDYKRAFEYSSLYNNLKDSLMSDETIQKLNVQRIQFEVEKAVGEEKANKEKALAIEKLKYQFSLSEEQAEQKKLFAAQQFENERKLADENAKHQQAITDERIRQEIKDAEAKTFLEKEKAAKKRRTEAYLAGLIGLALISIFAIIIIRQRNQKRRAIEKAETGHIMAELELQSLRAQLNPHFMFNSLNAIQDLIVNENSEKSHLYLSRFSKLLRMLLDNANQPFVTVKQELEFLGLYLSLENLRIPDLKFSIEKDPNFNTEERMVPNMMLQPYIENAIWHGLSNKKGDRKLQIRIHENGNATEFEIEDNGIGRKKAEEIKAQYKQGHHSKGMELLSKRFNLLSSEYGEAINTTVVDLNDNGNATGTLVKIDVPFSLSEQAKQLISDTNHHT